MITNSSKIGNKPIKIIILSTPYSKINLLLSDPN